MRRSGLHILGMLQRLSSRTSGNPLQSGPQSLGGEEVYLVTDDARLKHSLIGLTRLPSYSDNSLCSRLVELVDINLGSKGG